MLTEEIINNQLYEFILINFTIKFVQLEWINVKLIIDYFFCKHDK